jgi:predicted transcriptional regulator
MKRVKGYAEQKSRSIRIEESRLLLLHEWVNLVEEIQERKAVENPFETQFLQLLEELPITQQILFKSLAKSIAKMNASSRANPQSHKLLCSEGDNLNALQLILPESLQLKPTHDEILRKLARRFGKKSFTYLEVGTTIKCSRSSVKRKLQPLIMFKKLERSKHPNENKTVLKITQIAHEITTECYQEMMTDWEDFVGFEELRKRT